MSALSLSQLTLSHFRSHKYAALDLDPRPVAIFGPNGAGKTNLIEAVSLFSPGRGLRRASAQDLTRRPEAIGWKVSGILETAKGAREISFSSENGAPRQVKIDEKPVAQTVLGELARVLWLVPSMDRLWIEGPEGRRKFLDRLCLNFFPNHAQLSLDYEKAMRERNRLLKEQIRDAHWYQGLEWQMAKAGAEIHQNRLRVLDRLEQAQTKATTQFPHAHLDLTQTEGEMPLTAGDLREAFEESRFRDMAAGRSLVGPHRADLYGVYAIKGIAAFECSTGEQKALLISLILASARALSEDICAAPLLLLDEVAAHLDASRRAALYDEICALGAQAWMTGTGPELFAELGERAQYLEVTDTAEITRLGEFSAIRDV